MTQEELNQKLLDAVKRKNITEVKEVLSIGADVNSASDNGWTVLIWACHYGHTDIARLLIEHGADINIKNKNGKTALDILKEQYPDKYKKWIETSARKKQLEKEDSLSNTEQSIDFNI